MLPIWKIIFYALSAVAIVLLTRRYLRRRKAEQQSLLNSAPTEALAAQPTAPVVAARPSSNAHETFATVPVVAAPTKAAAAPAVTAHSLAVETYSPGKESRSHRGEAWLNQSLFYEENPEKTDVDTVPPVEPHEVPIYGTSDRLFGSATPIFAALLPESGQRQYDAKRELKAAGYYQPHALENLSALRYVLMMGSILFFGLLVLIVPPRLEGPTLFALATAAILGWAIPRLMVRSRATQRLSEIERAMPDMLDMLNMSVSQGITLHESLQRVSGQMEPVYPALAQELKIVCEQADIGSLDQALLNFSDRIDLPEVHSFTSLVTQTERMGTSISQALATYSDNMRENLRQRADEKANQATFKLLFPTVLFLMPAVFIFLLGPAIVELSEFYTGEGRAALLRGRQTAQDTVNRPNQIVPPGR